MADAVGPQPASEPIPCVACQIMLNGEEQLVAHLAGKRHRHAVRELLRQRNARIAKAWKRMVVASWLREEEQAEELRRQRSARIASTWKRMVEASRRTVGTQSDPVAEVGARPVGVFQREIFITKYGTCWHFHRDCPGLNRARTTEVRQLCAFCSRML